MQHGDVEPLLAIDAPTLGRPVPTMHVDQPVFRELSQPQVKRHGRIIDVITHPLARFKQNVLHNITGIDSRGDRPIQTHIHHFANGFTVTIHEVIDCGCLTISGSGEQLLRLFRIWPHVRCPQFVPCGSTRWFPDTRVAAQRLTA